MTQHRSVPTAWGALDDFATLDLAGRAWSVQEALLPYLAQLDGKSFLGSFDDIPDTGPNEDESPGAIAVVPLKGLLMSGGLLSMLFGIDPVRDFEVSLERAAKDDAVKQIVLDVDSPGGSVENMPELAAKVAAVKRKKPITAVVNTLAASGAYWLASQASEIAITPSGEAGSIGVYTIHRDVSAAAEQAGMKFTVISAGKYKTERNPYEPLSDSAEAALQESVNDYYELFTKGVAAGRGATLEQVKSGFGQGRALTAKRAVRAGLADRVATFDEVIAGLQEGRTPNRRRAEAEDETYTADEKHRLINMAELFGRDPQQEAAHAG
jgi:capsid assembly protease